MASARSTMLSLHSWRRRLCGILAVLALCIGVADVTQAAWAFGKAHIAQQLLERAWQRSEGQRPWPWADVAPALRLEVPALGHSLIVLDGASGEALAFGPGIAAGDPTRASSTLVIGGHRDSHLGFLANLPPDADFLVHDRHGSVRRYRSSAVQIVDTRHEGIAVNPDAGALVLVTCWPFDAPDAGGPLRYVLIASPISRTAAPASGRES